jgi:serine/threonine-protein kinase
MDREKTPISGPRIASPGNGNHFERTDTQPEVQKTSAPRAGVGTVVGDRYRLVSRLGGGAMGDVFVAENLAIRLRVAVKLLKPELLRDKVFRERFQQEAQAIAAIEHPNVARFLDLVVGAPTFLVMEYVRGQTLAERLREKGPMPMVDAVGCAVRLCWALGAAHAAGIIHRDLKPSNVILTPDLEHGETPKLIDFGLAKLAAQQEKSGLTRTGQVVGTPKYMSPEQIAGRTVDARSDLYSLGCLLFEMLTGRPPFNGEDDVQVLYQQIHDSPPPLRSLVHDSPEALEKVLLRMLSKQPDARFPTVGECARALDVALWTITPRGGGGELYGPGEDGRTLPRMGSTVMKKPVKPPPRNPFAMVLLVAAALVIGATGALVLAQRATRPVVVPSASQAGFLLVSEPAGANVTLDGNKLDRPTPTWAGGLQPGPHTIKFQREHVAPVTQTVTLRPDERAVVQVSLPPATHRLEVKSTPDGASLFLDGRLAFGETPTYVDITDDDFHELRVQKNGYQTVTKPITPDDKMSQLQIALKPETQARGTLMVDANSAAEVWIDGLNTGYTTPTLGIQLPVGKHTVELRDGSGGRGQSTVVNLQQGQTVRILLGAKAGK